jgi:nicotinamidase-related amidase
MTKLTTAPAPSMLTPDNHMLVMIDHQSQMAFATRSIDISLLRTNSALVAESAAAFSVPTILTTVAAKTFSGPIFEEISRAFPGAATIDRTTMNSFEDQKVVDAVNLIGKNRLVLAGLWTSVCIVGPALTALAQGFDVHVLADACGDVTDEAHDRAMDRMVQAGAAPMTSLQYLLELQRDWARGETYDLTGGIAKAYGGGYGLGMIYAKKMFGAQEGSQ